MKLRESVYLPCNPGAYIDSLFSEMYECRNAGLEVIGIFQDEETC